VPAAQVDVEDHPTTAQFEAQWRSFRHRRPDNGHSGKIEARSAGFTSGISFVTMPLGKNCTVGPGGEEITDEANRSRTPNGRIRDFGPRPRDLHGRTHTGVPLFVQVPEAQRSGVRWTPRGGGGGGGWGVGRRDVAWSAALISSSLSSTSRPSPGASMAGVQNPYIRRGLDKAIHSGSVGARRAVSLDEEGQGDRWRAEGI